jgi:hypothetical protein
MPSLTVPAHVVGEIDSAQRESMSFPSSRQLFALDKQRACTTVETVCQRECLNPDTMRWTIGLFCSEKIVGSQLGTFRPANLTQK